MTNTLPKADAGRRNFLKGAALLGGSAATLGGLTSTATAQDTTPIPIGCVSPLTGFVAADGIEFRNGLEMAAEEINALGGILGRPIELYFEDSESKGDDVVTQAAQRLVDRSEVHAIIAGYNLENGAVLLDVAADSGIIAMHANTVVLHDETVKGDPDRYWGGFQIDPPEIFYGTAFLNFVKNLVDSGQLTLANNKIAIITGPGAYSGNIANAMKDGAAAVGLQVSLFESVNVPISEWGPTLAKLRADPPGVIAITHFYPQDQAQFMLQFANDPTPSLVYMQYGASLAAFRDIAGAASEGVVYATTIGALQDEIGRDFSARYIAKYGPTPSPNSGGQTYYALHSYAVAASIAGGTGAPFEEEQNRKVAAALMSNIYRGVMGASRYVPETHSAYSYPNQTNDPSLGMPHIFSQIQDKAKDGLLIGPMPYNVAQFVKPAWIKA